MICWDVDPNTLTGTCVGMCTGGPDDPDCAQPDHWCFSNGTLSLCSPSAIPSLRTATPMDVRLPWPSVTILLLAGPQRDAGQVFSECGGLGTCDPGLSCELAEYALECDPMASHCCLPFCDLDDPNTCPARPRSASRGTTILPTPPASTPTSACAASRRRSRRHDGPHPVPADTSPAIKSQTIAAPPVAEE